MSQSVAAMSASDLELARQLMVDGQLRPSKVTDRRILDAMRELPRDSFLPAALADRAYIDEDLPLGGGRFLLKPLILARLLQLARPQAGEAALVVGAGCGYGAAILARCGLHVTALESDTALLALARPALGGFADLAIVEGDLQAGHAAAAPYDLVVIEGAVREIPAAIIAQLAATGRLVTILAPDRQQAGGTGGVAVLAEHSQGGLATRLAFDATAPLLPAFAPAPGFVF